MFWFIFSILATAATNYTVTNTSPQNPWPKFTKPTLEPAQIIGKYSGGCMHGAIELPQNENYQIMRPHLNRHFGHPSLVQFVQELSKQTKQKLFIGNLSQPRGGPMPFGHASHQIGLDVDIFFRDFSAGKPVSVLDNDGKNLLIDKWPTAMEQTIFAAAEHPKVQRIFINAAIKKHLCQKYPQRKELRKLRPWHFHDDHMHVRLVCPKDSPNCKGQSSPPPGTGCNNIDWWQSEEALAVWRGRTDKPVSRTQSLPLDCKKMTML